MDTTDSLGNKIGGGEILDIFTGSNYNYESPYLNNELIRLYELLPLIAFVIAILLVVIMIKIIMGLYNVKTLRKGKGIVNELEYVERVRARDKNILAYNRAIQRLTKIVEGSVFKSNRVNKEYVEYNLERAEVKIPGGARYYKAEEFNAVVVGISAIVIVVSVIVAVLANYIIGIIMIVFTLLMVSTLPMTFLRQTVKSKDDEIKHNFADMYLMMHYVLLAGAKTPLVGILKSYSKTTDSNEMKHLVDVCVHYMDTYGEYEGTRYITKAYREIPLMGKLMRLIRQSNEGGDIESELMGFRKELLDAKRYEIERRTDKIINKARASFNLLLPILFQAILSAMSIYFSDLGLISTFIS